MTAVLLAAVLAIQLPQVQTYLSGKIIGSIENRLDGEIQFDKIHVKPFNALVIKNISITDRNPSIEGVDTLFKAGYVIATFSMKGLFRKEGLHIGRAYVSDAEMCLVVEKDRVNLTRIFRIPLPDKTRPRKQDPVFDIRRASIYDMTFRLKNAKKGDSGQRHGTGIDWEDMEVRDIVIEARKINLTGQVMKGTLDFMSFTEKSGYVCNSLSGRATVGNGRSLIEEMKLSDPWSELYMPMFSMRYDDPHDFSDFISEIRLDGVIEGSRIDMKTLSFFAPALENTDLKTELSGNISGHVDDLRFKDMHICTPDSLEMVFDGSIAGLPAIGKNAVTLDIKELKTTTAGLGAVITAFSPEAGKGIGKIAEGVGMTLAGKVSGRLDDLSVDMTVSADSGSVRADVAIKNLISEKESISIAGDILARDFDIGKIIGTPLIRQCSMKTDFRADLGNKGEGPELAIGSLFVSRLNANGYDYSNIAAAGKMEKNAFDGRIVCNDPNLNFIFQGVFSLSPRTRNSVYRFFANLGYADLNALNIDKRGISKISLQASANFNRRQSGDMLGSMEISDMVLENAAGKYEIGDIGVNSYFGDELYRMKLRSSFADASYAGSEQITRFFQDLRDITLKRELPAMFRDTLQATGNGRYRIAFRCKNSMDLLAFVAPGLYISDSTSLDITVDSLGIFKADLRSPRIAFNENYIKDMEFKMDNINGSLSGGITGKTINAASISLENNSFRIFARDNFIGFGYTYENPGELVNRGEIFITADINREPGGSAGYHVEMLPSRVLLNSREWNINHSAFDIRGKDLDIEKIEFTSGDQAIRLSGGYSRTKQDTLRLRLERFDISIMNPLLKNRFGIEGAATGEVGVISPKQDHGLLFGFLVDSTRIAGSDVGTLRLSSVWNDPAKRFDAMVTNELDGQRTFGISGSYTPSKKRISASADLSGMDISYASPFLKSIFSEISGHLSGKIRLEGSPGDMSIWSEEARIDDSEVRIAFTNVPYRVRGDFHIDDSGVHFDDISLNDRAGNSGRVSGGITYDRLKDMRMDTRINITGMECLNIGEDDGNAFYGRLSASGNLAITGPMNALKMDITARTSGSGQLHIPIPSSATAVSGNLLTFKQEEKEEYVDPYELMIKKIKTDKQSSGDFGLNLDVEVTPEVEAFIEIDKATGNVLRGRGAGNIGLELHGGEFNILGDYTLTSGNYRFVAQGLAFRDFTIRDGSSIKFNGDIMESDLDINATYRTKASLATLIADTSSVSTRRIVDCGIHISDKIKNPRLAFSIDIPDIDPTIKSMVESALSTEDKVQKQFLSLIVFNSFLPDDQSGIVNNSVLYSTVTGLMYNQLNNIFQKLDIPLDMSLNYQPNERGQDIFDVAISTQLFNNRVVVNGNLGNQQYTSGNSGSDVVGDLDIEIKLDRPGLFRLNIFSHSADQYTNYLDDSQRNGVGLAYQQEFNTFREFLENLFTGKKKRKEQAAGAVPGEAVQDKKTIIIRPDDE